MQRKGAEQMPETKEKVAGGSPNVPNVKKRRGVPPPPPLPVVSQYPKTPARRISKKPKSVSFQIRTSPEIKNLAERVAELYEIGGRSKLDAETYKRGLLLSLVLLGPGADGSYAGMNEQEVARQLAPLFDRQYALLDKHQLLGNYVYRVLPPGVGQLVFGGTNAEGRVPATSPHTVSSTEEGQGIYTLSEEAQGTLGNFAEEI